MKTGFANSMLKKPLVLATALGALLSVAQAEATTVQIQTVMGDIEVNLFDKATPKTVENFLSYVNSGAYTDSIIHRSVPGFVIQGGGVTYSDESGLASIDTAAAVVNEPVYSNVRGTIAMAKLGGDPDSATSQWFFNLKDNSANLDVQNGGFTVFGQVTEDSMLVVDAIAAVDVFAYTSSLSTLPLRNFTDEDYADKVEATRDNFVMVDDVVVLDPSQDTADNLSPVENTLIDASSSSSSSSTPANNGGSGGGGGGSMGWLSLLALVTFTVARRKSVRGHK